MPQDWDKIRKAKERHQEERRRFVMSLFCQINGCIVRSSGPQTESENTPYGGGNSPDPSYYVEVEYLTSRGEDYTRTTYWNKPENLEKCSTCHRWACEMHCHQYAQNLVTCQNCLGAQKSEQLPQKRNKFLEWFRNLG